MAAGEGLGPSSDGIETSGRTEGSDKVEYVTPGQLTERLEDYATKRDLNGVKSKGFWHYTGEALESLVTIVGGVVVGTAVVGTLWYAGLTLKYGPVDAVAVFRNDLGNKQVKQIYVERAKWLYARSMLKQELDDEDMKNLCLQTGVVASPDKPADINDASWYKLTNWIEAND